MRSERRQETHHRRVHAAIAETCSYACLDRNPGCQASLAQMKISLYSCPTFQWQGTNSGETICSGFTKTRLTTGYQAMSPIIAHFSVSPPVEMTLSARTSSADFSRKYFSAEKRTAWRNRSSRHEACTSPIV